MFNWLRKQFAKPETKRVAMVQRSDDGGYTSASFGGSLLPSSNPGLFQESFALSIAALYCGVRVIGEALGGLPVTILEILDEGKQIDDSHYLNPIFREPNPDMTWETFCGLMVHNVYIWGDFFAEIQRRNNGQVARLWPLNPSNVSLLYTQNGLVYKFHNYFTGESKSLSQEDVFHIHGPTSNGLRGMPPSYTMRRMLELTQNAEVFGDSFLKNGLRSSGHFEYPTVLSDQALKNLQKTQVEQNAGAKNAGKVPIYEEGMKFVSDQISNNEGQYIETRAFQLGEVSRYLNLSPIFLHDLGRATWNNTEALNMMFVQQTIKPLANKVSAEARRKLLFDFEKDKYIVHFDCKSLLNAGPSTLVKFQTYEIGKAIGVWSVNEIREKEGENPIDDPACDEHLTGAAPVAMGQTPMGQGVADPNATEDNKESEAK